MDLGGLAIGEQRESWAGRVHCVRLDTKSSKRFSTTEPEIGLQFA